MYEYKTTHGDLGHGMSTPYGGEFEIEPADPRPPPGKGWEFVNGTASTMKLYFFWRRIITKIV